MARQRMLSDEFWDDPDLADLTIDERCTLLLLLTCKQSNVIGVYRVIWRQVGAGSGWTHDQVLNAARNLKKKEVIDIDEETGWVWVKEWWKHNSLRGAFTGNVAKKAVQELSKVPEFWEQDVLGWIAGHDPEGDCKPLLSPLQASGGNPTTSFISIPTTTDGGVVEDIDGLVEAAVWAARKAGPINNEAGFRHAVKRRILAGGQNNEDIHTLQAWRIHQQALAAGQERAANEQAIAAKQASASDARATEASTYFNSLDDVTRAMLVERFTNHIAVANPTVFHRYKKSGFQSKAVKMALLQFIQTEMADPKTGPSQLEG